MARVTVSITREVMGEQVTFTAEGESTTDANRKETLVEVSADVRQAMNEYLDTIATATPLPESASTNGPGVYQWEELQSIVRNVHNGEGRVKAMTTKNSKWGVPVYPEVLQESLNRKIDDVPTEKVDMPGWIVKVQYVDDKPKRVVEFRKNE